MEPILMPAPELEASAAEELGCPPELALEIIR
jgi:hypothetical protein